MPPRASGGSASGGRSAPGGRAERTGDARSARENPRQDRRQARAGAAGAYRLGYQRGRGGEDQQAAAWADHPHRATYEQGYAAGAGDRPAAAPATSPEPAKPPAASSTPARAPSRTSTSWTSWMPKEAGGLVLGVFLYAIGLNWIRGGPEQARAWLAAKFLNKVAATPGQTASEVSPTPAPPNVASDNGTGAVLPNPGGLAIPGLGGTVRPE